MIRGLSAIALASLAACSSLGLDPPAKIDQQDIHEDVIAGAAFVRADLEAALDDATRHDDRAAIACYSALLVKVEAFPDRVGAPVVGAVSAFQRARDVRRRIDAGISDEVHIACAALVSDARSTLLRLAKVLRLAVP